MASFFDRFSSKQLTIIIICITACFLMMGGCTMVLGNEDTSDKKEKKLVFDDDDDGDDVNGRKYKFVDKEDREEGVKDDSLVVNKALEGDADCGGLLSFNYFSGEGVTDLDSMLSRRRCARWPTM